MKFQLTDRKLFVRKLALLVTTTLLLAPLIYYKLNIPAALFIGGLLVLHAAFLYLYFARVPWRRLWQRKGEFVLRVAGVSFFIYLLSLIKFGGSPDLIILKLILATGAHIAILAGVMVVRVEEGATYGRS